MKFTLAPGDRTLEGYTIKEGLGRGGFGEVYRALSDGGKEVALKLVQRNWEVELRGVSQCLNLKHPNLVAVYDVKQAENGDYWIVMEFLGGDSLDKVIARNPQGMPPEEALNWLRGICDGVGYLHERGIVHRDLKPGNIFIENAVVKIGDYGLSKFISASRRSGQTGSVGTVHYMAPEVANGRYGKEVDLYAIGVILYEMLTGHVPFDGESPGEILMKHLTAEPDLTVLPTPFATIVGRLLEKEPQRRYPSVRAMMAEVESYISGVPVTQTWQEDPAVKAEAVNYLSSVGQPPSNPIADAFRRVGPTHAQATSVPVLMRLLIALFWGAGIGFTVGAIGASAFKPNEEYGAMLGLAVGLLTAGIVASKLLISFPAVSPVWRAGIALFWGAGAGFLVGVPGAAITEPDEEIGVLFGLGVGFLTTGILAYRLLFGSLLRQAGGARPLPDRRRRKEAALRR